MPFVKLTSATDLPAVGEAKEFPCDDKTICVANVNGTYSAMDDVCPHRGGPLGQGMIKRGKVICPWHAWAWDPTTGTSDQNSEMKAAIYSVKIENTDVLIEI